MNGVVEMAKQGQRIADDLKERIRAALVLTENKNEIAKSLNVSWSTVNKVAKEIENDSEENEKFTKLRDDKKQQLIDKLWDNIVDAAALGHSMIQEAREGKRDIPLGQISTYLGTLYDKRALMNNESTANTTTTVKLVGELDEWAN